MAIRVMDWDDQTALVVFRQLDANDQREAELVRGQPATGTVLWADWRAMAPHAVLNVILQTAAGVPFAVCAVSNTGQSGVAQAALLARDHARFRRPLAQAAWHIRARLPGWATGLGIHRIEARAWAGHPTAARLLTAIGFAPEASLPGFGPGGRFTFRQFAWVDPGASGPAVPPADPAPSPIP